MKRNMIHTPEGVRDIYGNELERKFSCKEQIHSVLQSYGFHDIQTPTFEFFDIFSNEVGTTPSKELYKFFDKEGNTLVLRPDFTPSIARCAAKYFMEDATPIRLCYEGSAFTNGSELQGKFKETTQMGAELIGDNTVIADAEMICMVIEALKSVGFVEFTVSIGEIDYFKGMCEEAGLNEETIATLRKYVSAKNYFGAEEALVHRGVEEKYLDALVKVSDICTIKELAELKKNIHNEKSLSAIQRLEEIYRVIEMYGYEDYVSIDLGMLSKFHYYTGVIFKVYTYGVGDAIVKGGRYDFLLSQFGKDAPAIGCVFLVDEIMNALRAQKKLPVIASKEHWIVYEEKDLSRAITRLKELRKQNIFAVNIPLTTFPCKADKTPVDKETIQSYAEKNHVTQVEFI